MKRLVAFVLAVALLATLGPAVPAVAGEETSTWEQTAESAGLVSDILTAANVDDDGLKFFSEYLGHALIGIGIGDAWSSIQQGDVEGGLSTVATLVGETAVGLTEGGPTYALVKLTSQTVVYAVENNLNWDVEQRYAVYKERRTRGLFDNLNAKRLPDFVAWAKSGRPVFNAFAAEWISDGAARVLYMNKMKEERRAAYSLTDRVGYQLWPFSDGARKYQAETAHVYTDAEIKDYIFAEWEGRLVTEVLQEVARRKLEAAREAARNTVVLIRGSAADANGTRLADDSLALVDAGGQKLATAWLPSLLGGLVGADQFGIPVHAELMSAISGRETLRMMSGALRLHEFTMDGLLRQKGPTQKAGGKTYLVRDLGALRAAPAGVTVTFTTAQAASGLTLDAVDPLLRVLGQWVDQATGLLTVQVEGPPGRTVQALVSGIDSRTGRRRERPVNVTVPSGGGGSTQRVDLAPAPAMPASASLESVLPAMRENQQMLFDGRLDRSGYDDAQERIVAQYGAFRDSLGQPMGERLRYEQSMLASEVVALQNAQTQLLWAQVESFATEARALRAAAERAAAAVKDPADYLPSGSTYLYPLKRRLEQFETYASRYERFLDEMAGYQASLATLRQRYQAATAEPRRFWHLLSVGATGADEQLRADMNRLDDLLLPHLRRRDAGYVAALRRRKPALESRRDALQVRADRALSNVKAAQTALAAASARLNAVLVQEQRLRAAGAEQELDAVLNALLALTRDPTPYTVDLVTKGNRALDRLNTLLGKSVSVSAPAAGEANGLGLLERLAPWRALVGEIAAATDPELLRLGETGSTDDDVAPLFNALAGAADFTGEEQGYDLQVDAVRRVRDYVKPLRDAGAALEARMSARSSWPTNGGYTMDRHGDLDRLVMAILNRMEQARTSPAASAAAARLSEAEAAVSGLPGRMTPAAVPKLTAAVQALAALHARVLAEWPKEGGAPELQQRLERYGDQLYGDILPTWFHAQAEAWTALNRDLAQLDSGSAAIWNLSNEARMAELGRWAGRMEALRKARSIYSMTAFSAPGALAPAYARHQTKLQAAIDQADQARTIGEKYWQDGVGDWLVKPQPVQEPGKIQLRLRSREASVDGVSATLDRELPVRNDRTMVPVRWVGEAMGALVMWDDSERKVTYVAGSRQVELWVGKNRARVDGADVTLDPAPEIIGNRTYVPLRFVSEALGARVTFDGATGAITVEFR